MNDGHTFVALDQIQEEFKNILNLMVDVYHDFDINDYTFRLSYRDPENTEKYFDDDEMWNRAQTMLKGAMDEMGLDYTEAEGEAASMVQSWMFKPRLLWAMKKRCQLFSWTSCFPTDLICTTLVKMASSIAQS